VTIPFGGIVYSVESNPFRFDYARNECLKFIPEDIDICVSADIDDVIEFGWREHLKNAWTKETTRGLYLYNWSFNADGSPALQYTHERIYSRYGFRWIYPTHEILEYLDEERKNNSNGPVSIVFTGNGPIGSISIFRIA